MLKRIFTIALITGAGQLFIVFALKYISKHSSAEQIRAVAQIDSLILFMMNAIALGLQPATMRSLALAREWKNEYIKAQSARITLALFMTLLAILSFINGYYIAFLAAPLLAWSGDYALYARGHPIAGSLIAFVRAVVPFAGLILLTNYYSEWLGWIYLVAISLVYIATNLLISGILKTPWLPLPAAGSLRLYAATLSLGVVSLGLYFIGMGVVLIAPYFYSDAIVATAFVGLKFYVIFKGVLRIIQQAFLKEMIQDEICLKVDKLSSLLGLTFAAFIICFPDTFIRLFFGGKYTADRFYFILLGIAAFIYSLFSSFTTRVMLDKKDYQYAVTAMIAAVCTIIFCIFLSFGRQGPESVGISIIAGEIFFAAGMLRLMKPKHLLTERLLFILTKMPFLIIPVIGALIDDNITVFTCTLILYGITVFITHRHQFNLPAET